ncbi:MAG TPA: carbonic anhydrase [Chroococcales cyanobacterium]
MSVKGKSPDKQANRSDTIHGIARELSGLSCIKRLDDVQLSDGLLSGSIKNAAIVACSDMGCSVPYVCSSPALQLFLFQNFGHSCAIGGLVETIVESRIEHVIVYGHSVCEYTRFLAESVFEQSQTDGIQPTEIKEQQQLYAAALQSNSEALWEKVAQYNVLFEMKKLIADPLIGSLAARGRFSLHGWFYSSLSNRLEVFDPKLEKFIAPHV